MCSVSIVTASEDTFLFRKSRVAVSKIYIQKQFKNPILFPFTLERETSKCTFWNWTFDGFVRNMCRMFHREQRSNFLKGKVSDPSYFLKAKCLQVLVAVELLYLFLVRSFKKNARALKSTDTSRQCQFYRLYVQELFVQKAYPFKTITSNNHLWSISCDFSKDFFLQNDVLFEHFIMSCR